MNNHKVLKDVQLEIKKNTIQYEDHTIQVANISRIWSGTMPNKGISLKAILILMFLAYWGISYRNWMILSVTAIIFIVSILYGLSSGFLIRGLNIELCNGSTYTFLSQRNDFTEDTHLIIRNMMSEPEEDLHYRIDFKRYKITSDHLEQPEEKIPVDEVAIQMVVPEVVPEKDSLLISDLEKLYTYYSAGEEKNNEILGLIQETMRQSRQEDKDGMKVSFGQFVSKGMIITCNKLGLSYLIEQLRELLF